MKLIFMNDVFTVLVHFFDWYDLSISLSTKSIDVITLGPPKLSELVGPVVNPRVNRVDYLEIFHLWCHLCSFYFHYIILRVFTCDVISLSLTYFESFDWCPLKIEIVVVNPKFQ